MIDQKQWESPKDDSLQKEKTLQSIQTSEVYLKQSDIKHAGTAAIQETIKSTEEVIHEMKTWLRTGIAPDGTRMMTDEASQWYQDFYQATIRGDEAHEALPEDSTVQYYYWSSPFLAHIGNMNMLMMHSEVHLRDGTHLPCDRLSDRSRLNKNLRKKAEKRLSHEKEERHEFVEHAMDPGAHRGHPLRKEGIYTRYIWRPLIKEDTMAQLPERAPTVIQEARQSSQEPLAA